MQLKKLLQNVRILSTNADMNTEIKGIKISSSTVEEGDMFVCMEGVKDDGNKYIKDIKCNFVVLSEKVPNEVVTCNNDIDLNKNSIVKACQKNNLDDIQNKTVYVQVENVRKAYSTISANWFLNPLDGMIFVAVVGTNGKTSTAHYIGTMLTFAGYKVGIIGTEGHYIMGEKVGESLTTPDPYELHELFFKMRAKGVEIVVSEVSAHAIFLEKLDGIVADIALLTNVTQDHLDYFKSFDNYCGVKMSYFDKQHTKCAIVNVDDKSGQILIDRLEKDNLKFKTFGLYNPSDCFAINVQEGIDGVNFIANLCDDIVEVKSGLYGEFNVYNLLASLSVLHELGIDAKTLEKAVRKVRPVKGRFSLLKNDKGTIIIDYAHTPDGLKNILSTARTLTKSRLITVFGCGGERDKSKRGLMGEIASKYSDYVVITSDNPRFEDAGDIMRDIEFGVTCKDYKTIVDRTEAVRFALSEMDEGDTVVIAGKGNEGYLDIRGKKIPYNDFDTVARFGQLR